MARPPTQTLATQTQQLPAGAKMFQVDGKAYYSPSGVGYDAIEFNPQQYGINISALGSGIQNATIYQGGGTTGAQGGGVPTGGITSTLSNDEMRKNLLAILPQNVVDTIPDNMLASFSAISDSFKQQYQQGTVNADIQAADLQKAIDSVANDVEFKAKYGDSLALSNDAFKQTLQDYQFQTGQIGEQQKDQFLAQRKQLAEASAAAGQAYSGFREQAKQQLAKEQTGIIESTRQQIKNQLQNLGTSYEAQFGTAAVKTPTTQYVNPMTGVAENYAYNQVGGIYGSQPLAMKQEQEQAGAQRYGNVKLPI